MIRCTTKPEKFKNLTLNKEYDGTEEGDNYVLLNDAGISAKYNKRYFTTVVPMLRSTPINEALSVDAIYEENFITINATIGRYSPINTSVDFYQADNSCGIKELQGISNLKNACRNLYDRLDHERYTGTLTDLFKMVFDALIETCRDNMGACVMVTDAVRDTDAEMDYYISSIADAFWTGTNDNSGNTINVWIIGK